MTWLRKEWWYISQYKIYDCDIELQEIVQIFFSPIYRLFQK